MTCTADDQATILLRLCTPQLCFSQSDEGKQIQARDPFSHQCAFYARTIIIITDTVWPPVTNRKMPLGRTLHKFWT